MHSLSSLSDHPFAVSIACPCASFPSVDCYNNSITTKVKTKMEELEPMIKSFGLKIVFQNQPSTIHCEAPHPATLCKNPFLIQKIKLNGEKLSKENISKPTKLKSESKNSHFALKWKRCQK
ncbi:hypothetical protein TNCV_873861 [Trichonephila clavipes]|nr:hypothetical protein TNCV_873861 [Trichonephila clavipes]